MFQSALTVPEAAEDLRVSKSLVWKLIASGELKSFKVGKCRRIQREALDDFVARRLAGAQ